MNILYGIQATGNGHITRSKLLVQQLRETGHKVQVILSGRKPADLWDVEELMPYEVFTGLTYAQYKGKVHYWQTVRNLRLMKFISDVVSYNTAEIDLVITDFDPVSAYIAKLKKIPSIGIGHQYAFNFDIPKAGENLITNLIIKIFAPVDIKVGLHWSDFGQPILPPIIPKFELDKRTDDKKILVYLPYEDQGFLMKTLSTLENYSFHIYTDQIEPGRYSNITIKPFSKINFRDDLTTCYGVICNAGFALPSEALSLGKKILVKPLEKQMEQISNAKAIELLELGAVMYEINLEKIKNWLSIDRVSNSMAYHDVINVLSEWITDGDWSADGIEMLSKQIWNNGSMVQADENNMVFSN